MSTHTKSFNLSGRLMLAGLGLSLSLSAQLQASTDPKAQREELLQTLSRRFDWLQNGFLVQCPQYHSKSLIPIPDPGSKPQSLLTEAGPVGMAGIFFSPGFEKIAGAARAVPRVLAIGTAITATAAVSGFAGWTITEKWGPGNQKAFAQQIAQDSKWTHTDDRWKSATSGPVVDFKAAQDDVDQLMKTHAAIIRHLHNKELEELELDSGTFGGRVDFLRKRKDQAPELYQWARCSVILQTQRLLLARLSDLNKLGPTPKTEEAVVKEDGANAPAPESDSH